MQLSSFELQAPNQMAVSNISLMLLVASLAPAKTQERLSPHSYLTLRYQQWFGTTET